MNKKEYKELLEFVLDSFNHFEDSVNNETLGQLNQVDIIKNTLEQAIEKLKG